MRFSLIILFLFISANVLSAQADSSLINTLLRQIDSAQYKHDDGEFYAGMFKGYRSCGGGPHNYQPDNNIFFTAVTAFGLKNMAPYLSGDNKIIATNIVKRAATSYPYFQNQYGNPYYGFWPTHAIIMPHTFIFKYLKSVFGQGEDSDDTVMVLMSADTPDSTAVALKKRLIALSNTSRKKIISTYKKYSDIPAYSTWLGDRMTPDFDFAVQCNIMYFILQNNMPLARQDSATIQLLAEMVKNREYMTDPVFLSPYYVHSSILLYHLTRLMSAFKIPELEIYKQQLIADTRSLLPTSNNVMDQIILRTSLLRLGAEAPELSLHSLKDFDESNQNSFVFFQARAAFSFPAVLKKVFLHWSYIYYLFYCPTYNKMLWMEYLVEKERRESTIH